MGKKFIVCVDDSTKEQQNTLTKYFKDVPTIGYWHWFSDLWLITSSSDTWSAANIRDKVREVLPGTSCMVIDATGSKEWGGFGDKKIFEWMNGTWDNT